jgi:hypothetical protein
MKNMFLSFLSNLAVQSSYKLRGANFEQYDARKFAPLESKEANFFREMYYVTNQKSPVKDLILVETFVLL